MGGEINQSLMVRSHRPELLIDYWTMSDSRHRRIRLNGPSILPWRILKPCLQLQLWALDSGFQATGSAACPPQLSSSFKELYRATFKSCRSIQVEILHETQGLNEVSIPCYVKGGQCPEKISPSSAHNQKLINVNLHKHSTWLKLAFLDLSGSFVLQKIGLRQLGT